MKDFITESKNINIESFNESSLCNDTKLKALIRHLARISAEDDYKYFIELQSAAKVPSYSGGIKK